VVEKLQFFFKMKFCDQKVSVDVKSVSEISHKQDENGDQACAQNGQLGTVEHKVLAQTLHAVIT
jgi:hypothetical protein